MKDKTAVEVEVYNEKWTVIIKGRKYSIWLDDHDLTNLLNHNVRDHIHGLAAQKFTSGKN